MKFEEYLSEGNQGASSAQMAAMIKKHYKDAKVKGSKVTFTTSDSPSDVRKAIKTALPGTWHQSSRKMPGEDIEFYKPYEDGHKAVVTFKGGNVTVDLEDGMADD